MYIKRPIGITIIAILIILNGSFLLLSGIASFILSSNLTSNFDSLDLSYFNLTESMDTKLNNIDPEIFKTITYLLYFIAGIIILFSIIHFLIAYGLLKGKSKARIAAIIISIISIIANSTIILIVFSSFNIANSVPGGTTIISGNILTIIINSLIVYYLYRKEVIDYFNFMFNKRSSFDDLR